MTGKYGLTGTKRYFVTCFVWTLAKQHAAFAKRDGISWFSVLLGSVERLVIERLLM